MGDLLQEVPELVPARMLNEFIYCPRLFYLEWVDRLWASNSDVTEGLWQHRRVDQTTGAVPLPEDGQTRRATSVSVSSESLGLTAKIDLLEGEGATVIPVDTKKGSQPDVEFGAWPPERMQVAAQVLLLREAGYACPGGEIYFAEDRSRVQVVVDDQVESEITEILQDLRGVALGSEAPKPLLDSPKCPRCSLVGICLPDESNILAKRSDQAPRNIAVRDRAPRPLYLSEQGAVLKKRKGRLDVFIDGGKVDSVRLIDVSQVSVFGNVQISSQALSALFGAGTPVAWFSYGGWFRGIAHGMPGKNVSLRMRQLGRAATPDVILARQFVTGKVRNSRTLLMRNASGDIDQVALALKQAAINAETADSVESLLGIEGAAARSYFSAFDQMRKVDAPGKPFVFDGRNRRPARDPINCLLSYVYSMIVKDLTIATLLVGFDPYLGFYHRPRFGRPALALDLAEEFRPLIGDSVVVGMINNGEIVESDFVTRAGAVALTSDGRKKVLSAYERRLETEVTHPIFGYKMTYRRVFEAQSRLLAGHLLGEYESYTPMVTR